MYVKLQCNLFPRSCAIRCSQNQEDSSLYVGLCSACSGGTVSIERVKDTSGEGDSSVPFRLIDNEYATYEFHAGAIAGDIEDDFIDDNGEEDNEEDEDYDPEKDYIKEEEVGGVVERKLRRYPKVRNLNFSSPRSCCTTM